MKMIDLEYLSAHEYRLYHIQSIYGQKILLN